MTTARSQSLIVTSAAVVAGVYAYKRYNDPGQSASLQVFATAWGVIFFILALGAEVAPGPAGAMAVLVMVSDLLANTQGLAGQVTSVLSGKISSSPSAAAGAGGGAGSTLGQIEARTGASAPSPAAVGAAAAKAAQANAAGLSHAHVTPGGTSVQAAAAAEGLHFDPTTGQYEPI